MAFPTPEEFEHQRQLIRAAFQQPFEAVEEQLIYVAEHTEEMRPVEKRLYDLVLKAHLARCTKTALGIVRLCEHGFGELAMSSLRVLAEGVVSAYFVSLDPDVRAEQFAAYEELERLEVLGLARELAWLDEPELEVPEALQNAERVAEVRARFANPVQGWFQLPMKTVVAEIEPCWGDEAGRREFRQAATIVRFFGDRHSHLGAYDTGKYLDLGDDDVLKLQFGPSKDWVPQALTTAAWFYGQMFDLAAEHFALPDIEAWRSRFRLLICRCRTLDPALVHSVGRNDPCPCGSGAKFKHCHLDLLK